MIHLVWALLDLRKKAAAFLACQQQTSERRERSGKGESHLDTLDPNEPLLVSTAVKLEVCSKCAKGSVKKGLRIGGSDCNDVVHSRVGTVCWYCFLINTWERFVMFCVLCRAKANSTYIQRDFVTVDSVDHWCHSTWGCKHVATVLFLQIHNGP